MGYACFGHKRCQDVECYAVYLKYIYHNFFIRARRLVLSVRLDIGELAASEEARRPWRVPWFGG